MADGKLIKKSLVPHLINGAQLVQLHENATASLKENNNHKKQTQNHQEKVMTAASIQQTQTSNTHKKMTRVRRYNTFENRKNELLLVKTKSSTVAHTFIAETSK